MSKPLTSIGKAFTDPKLLGAHFEGPSWDPWRAILKAAFAESLTDRERAVFHELSGGRPLPKERVKELWVIAGRRSGKTSIAAGTACYLAAFTDYSSYLRPGERALLPVFSTSRDQSQVCAGYIRSMLKDTKLLRGLVESDGYETMSLNTKCDLGVMTASFRSSRGRTMAGAILEETGFWRSDTTSIPDLEIYRAIKPSLSTIKGSMVIGISSAYRRSGLLWTKFRDHFGKDSTTLVIKATTAQLNGTIDKALIDEELAADPSAAAAEWLSEWRLDLQSYIDREVLEELVVKGRHELAPEPGQTYSAFTDAAGGSGSDSFTLAIGHHDDRTKRAVLDVLRERKPRFSPSQVAAEYSALLRDYRCYEVAGDKFAKGYVGESFEAAGINYVETEESKSEIYQRFLGPLNNSTVELLDIDKLVTQFAGLVRTTSKGVGRPSIDHDKGGHDDLCNAAAGCLVALGENTTMQIWERLGAPDRPRMLPPPPELEPDLLDVRNSLAIGCPTHAGEPTVIVKLPCNVALPQDDPSAKLCMLPKDKALELPTRLLRRFEGQLWIVRTNANPVQRVAPVDLLSIADPESFMEMAL
jgi:hypothetical protein